MKSLFAVLLVGGSILPAAAHAQSLDGDWAAAMNTPGGTINFGIAFKLKGDTVTGTVHRSAGDVPLYGTIKGDTVTFGYTVQYNGHDLNLTMTAKLVRDSLTGTVDFDGQSEDQFWAARVKPTPGAPPVRRESPPPPRSRHDRVLRQRNASLLSLGPEAGTACRVM